MTNAKFYRATIIIVAFISLLICIFNFALDAYGIWGLSYDYQMLEPNKNYVKTKFVLDNPDKFDSFLFGSSRVGHIEVDKLTNGSFYNMCYSEGLPLDWLQTIETFVEHDIEIKNVVLGIDDFSFMLDPNAHQKNLLRIPYYKLNLYNKIRYYILRNPFDLYNITTIKALLKNQMPFTQYDDIFTTGVAYGNDDVVEILGDAHTNNPIFLEPTDFYQLNRSDKAIDEIQKIFNLCEENNINLYVFYNPIHHVTYDLHKELNNENKKKLQKVVGYWDFSGNSSVTRNNYYWYETSHYRHNVGLMILEKLFKADLDIEMPSDFGTYRLKIN